MYNSDYRCFSYSKPAYKLLFCIVKHLRDKKQSLPSPHENSKYRRYLYKQRRYLYKQRRYLYKYRRYLEFTNRHYRFFSYTQTILFRVISDYIPTRLPLFQLPADFPSLKITIRLWLFREKD